MSKSLLHQSLPGYVYLNQDVVDEMKQLSGGVGDGTVDELGFGPLYNKIAEALFPWCSTLTSRARYFFFSLCVLDLALEEVIDAKEVDSVMEAYTLQEFPRDKQEKLIAVIRRIEKALSLSLSLKDIKAKGVFGTRNTKDYLSKGDLLVKKYKKILSLDSRYPNVIYRGSCVSLQMFNGVSSNIGMIGVKLKGHKIFDADWGRVSKGCRAEIKAIDAFWKKYENDSFGKARVAFPKSSACKIFRGFQLTKDEASFLFNKIKEISPYFNNLTIPVLKKIVNSDNLNLELLQKNIKEKKQRDLLEAAIHINTATKEFRALYESYCTKNFKYNCMKISKVSIQKSIDWLDINSNRFVEDEDWGEAWNSGIGDDLKEWLKLVSKNGCATEALIDKLCHRADLVVSQRGIGKKAPHNKRKKTSLKSELNFIRESSFRIWNGALILRDILDEIKTK